MAHRSEGLFHSRHTAKLEGLGWHLSFRLADSRPFLMMGVSPAGVRRIIARILLDKGQQRGLLAFGVADNHFHAQLAATRQSAGLFARTVELQVRWQLHTPVHFEPVRIERLATQAHVMNTFFYNLRQDTRHETYLDLMHEGTAALDLLGMRVVDPSIGQRVRDHLPRIRSRDLVPLFPVNGFTEPDTIELSDLCNLQEAAASALALPHLADRSVEAVRARRAAVHAVAPDCSSTVRIGECLNLARRTVQALRAGPREEPLIAAIRLQLRFRRGVSSR